MGKLTTTLKLIAAFAVLHSGLTAQDTTTAMRIEADKIYLRTDVHVESDSAMPGFAALLKTNTRAGGMIIASSCGDTTQYTVHIPAGSSLAVGLNIITSTYPEDFWTIQDGVVNLLPKQGVPPVMNVGVRQFEWDTAANEQPPVFRLFDSNGIKDHLAEIGIVPYSGLEYGPGLQKPPRIINGVAEPRQGQKYKIENVTLLTALNMIVASYGDAFWWYEEQKCGGQKTYRISVR